jgi:hypothetical protein
MPFIVVLLLIAALLALSSVSGYTASQQQIKESEQLTIQAQDELNRHNFDSAMRLIRDAIRLNPSNEKAKGLYVNLREFVLVRQPKTVQGKDVKKQNDVISDNKISATAVPVKKEEPEKTEKKIQEHSGSGYIELGLQYTFGKSNYLDYINSSIQMIGGRAEGGYFFSKSGTSLGFSADYSWSPLKVAGNSNIDITIHKVDVFLCGRTSFFGIDDQSLVAGVRAGYHYFLLQNNKSEGVFYFRQVNGPVVGLFLSDPLFYRFWKTESVKSFGIEGGLNCIPLLKKGSNGLALEYNAALTYRISEWQFSLGWRSYQVDNGKVQESFSVIEMTMRYRF